MTVFNSNIKNWLDWSRWLDLHPQIMNLGWVKFLLSLSVALILVAIIVKIIIWKKNNSLPSRARKKFYTRIAGGSFYFGLALAVFVGCALERIYLFSARLWLVVWLLSFIAWLIVILRYRFKVVPMAEAKILEQNLFSKYLIPKRRQT